MIKSLDSNDYKVRIEKGLNNLNLYFRGSYALRSSRSHRNRIIIQLLQRKTVLHVNYHIISALIKNK